MKIFYTDAVEAKIEGLVNRVAMALRDSAMSAAEAGAVKEQNKVLQVQLDFMRHRVNQLELERAMLLQKVSGIAIPVPEIVPQAKQLDVRELLQAMPSFEDIGDDEAAKLGIRTDPSTGELVYTSDKKD